MLWPHFCSLQAYSPVAHHIHTPGVAAATLFQAWHNRKLLHQLVQRVAEILQDVDKLEAQALPDKDPEFVNAPNAIWAAARRWLHH